MLKKNLSPGNSIFNSAISLYCSIKGNYPSDYEIAREFGVGQPTLHRWRKGKVQLDQITVLARILQKIPKELRTIPFDSFESTLHQTEALPDTPPPILTEVTLTPLTPTRLLSGIVIVGQSATNVAAHLSSQMLLEPTNRFHENLLLHPEASAYFQKLSALPGLNDKTELLQTAAGLPLGTKTFVAATDADNANSLVHPFLERITRSRSFELDPGHRSLLLAPLSTIIQTELNLQLIQAKRVSAVLYTDSLTEINSPIRRSLLRKCKKLLYLHTTLEAEQALFDEITHEYNINTFQFPLRDLQKEETTEEGYLCQTNPSPQVTRRRFQTIL